MKIKTAMIIYILTAVMVSPQSFAVLINQSSDEYTNLTAPIDLTNYFSITLYQPESESAISLEHSNIINENDIVFFNRIATFPLTDAYDQCAFTEPGNVDFQDINFDIQHIVSLTE